MNQNRRLWALTSRIINAAIGLPRTGVEASGGDCAAQLLNCCHDESRTRALRARLSRRFQDEYARRN
jgi:hypothetical protein